MGCGDDVACEALHLSLDLLSLSLGFAFELRSLALRLTSELGCFALGFSSFNTDCVSGGVLCVD